METLGKSLFVYIDEWNGQRLFMYGVISLIILWIFINSNVTLGLIVGLGVAYFVISYLNHKTLTESNTLKDIRSTKKSTIKPSINHTKSKIDAIDFIFSIQDLRKYNPQAFEELVHRVDNFFELYDVVMIEPSRSYTYYELMEQFKLNALNALQSMTFSIPEDRRVRSKLNESTKVLDKILTKYLDQISYITDEYTHKYGYNVDTKILNYSQKPYNQYDDIFQPYSYEIY